MARHPEDDDVPLAYRPGDEREQKRGSGCVPMRLVDSRGAVACPWIAMRLHAAHAELLPPLPYCTYE